MARLLCVLHLGQSARGMGMLKADGSILWGQRTGMSLQVEGCKVLEMKSVWAEETAEEKTSLGLTLIETVRLGVPIRK